MISLYELCVYKVGRWAIYHLCDFRVYLIKIKFYYILHSLQIWTFKSHEIYTSWNCVHGAFIHVHPLCKKASNHHANQSLEMSSFTL